MGTLGETLDQCRCKVDLTLHVSQGHVDDVGKVLQGLGRVRHSGREKYMQGAGGDRNKNRTRDG